MAQGRGEGLTLIEKTITISRGDAEAQRCGMRCFRHGKRISAAVFILAVLGALAAFPATAGAESVDSLNPLFQTLATASFIPVAWERLRTPDQPLSRTRGVFLGRSAGGDWAGAVVHLSTPGYGGPIDLLVAFDTDGEIIKVNVFRHTETDCHVLGMTKGKFLDQFIGVSLLDQLRLLVGLIPRRRGDIQAMTDGTITSRAVSEAVAEARIVFHGLWGRNVYGKSP